MNQQAKETMEKIIKTADDIKDKVKLLDFDYVNKNSVFFTKFFDYSGYCPDIVSFIRGITNFKYEPFKNISLDNISNSAEKLTYLSKLSEIYNYPFIKNITADWKFDKLEDSIISFIETNEQSTIIEYTLLKSLLGKLIILMTSDVERAFSLGKSNMSPNIKAYLNNWVDKMKKFGTIKNNVSKSWSIFINTLFNESEIYIFKNGEQLENLLIKGYSSHFLLEALAANILKSLQTSILIDYFHAIKFIYIWCRMVSIMVQKYNFSSREQLMENLYVLSRLISSMYEDNYFINSILPKSLPSNDNLTEETILYFVNHTIKGPQYLIIKQLENSAPFVLDIGKGIH